MKKLLSLLFLLVCFSAMAGSPTPFSNGITISGTNPLLHLSGTDSTTVDITVHSGQLYSGTIPIVSGTSISYSVTSGTANNALLLQGHAASYFAPATTGTSILVANGAGGFNALVVGSGLMLTSGTLSASGGGSQTPWTSDIDGGGFTISNVANFYATGTAAQLGTYPGQGGLLTVTDEGNTGHVFMAGNSAVISGSSPYTWIATDTGNAGFHSITGGNGSTIDLSIGGTGIASLSLGASNDVYTDSNTLDDGSSNAIIAGNLTVNGNLIAALLSFAQITVNQVEGDMVGAEIIVTGTNIYSGTYGAQIANISNGEIVYYNGANYLWYDGNNYELSGTVGTSAGVVSTGSTQYFQIGTYSDGSVASTPFHIGGLNYAVQIGANDSCITELGYTAIDSGSVPLNTVTPAGWTRETVNGTTAYVPYYR